MIEQSHDGDGIVWPMELRALQFIYVLDHSSPGRVDLAKKIAAAAERAGADVLVDDRVERPGEVQRTPTSSACRCEITIGGKGIEGRHRRAEVAHAKGRRQGAPVAEIEARVGAAVAKRRRRRACWQPRPSRCGRTR